MAPGHSTIWALKSLRLEFLNVKFEQNPMTVRKRRIEQGSKDGIKDKDYHQLGTAALQRDSAQRLGWRGR